MSAKKGFMDAADLCGRSKPKRLGVHFRLWRKQYEECVVALAGFELCALFGPSLS